MWRRSVLALAFTALATLGTGCVHPISFQDTSWHYRIRATKQEEAALVAVIDARTATATYGFRAFSTGIAQKWVAKYGEMLEQVADVELPQLVGSYERSASYLEPTTGENRLTLVLTVPSYVFEDYRAKLTLHVEAFGPGRSLIFSRSYSSQGYTEEGKMVMAGAFGQKSAVRQSSLDAFKQVFAQMRREVVAALKGSATAVAWGVR